MIRSSKFQTGGISPQKNTLHPFPRNTHNSEQLSTSPHSQDDAAVFKQNHIPRNVTLRGVHSTSKCKSIIKLKIYCISEEIECCGDRECIDRILFKLQSVDMPNFTKICIRLLLLKRLAQSNVQYLHDFQATLWEYQNFQQNFI